MEQRRAAAERRQAEEAAAYARSHRKRVRHGAAGAGGHACDDARVTGEQDGAAELPPPQDAAESAEENGHAEAVRVYLRTCTVSATSGG